MTCCCACQSYSQIRKESCLELLQVDCLNVLVKYSAADGYLKIELLDYKCWAFQA